MERPTPSLRSSAKLRAASRHCLSATLRTRRRPGKRPPRPRLHPASSPHLDPNLASRQSRTSEWESASTDQGYPLSEAPDTVDLRRGDEEGDSYVLGYQHG